MSEPVRQRALDELHRTAATGDADTVDQALAQAYRVGMDRDFVPVLLELLKAPWHHRHEDIVLELQRLKDPSAINPLHDAAFVQHAYLNHDEYFGLARKCTWALADTGSAEARLRLESMARAENQVIAAYAHRRLERWEDERHRKGYGA